jgi:enoyl-CoA hydratase
MSAQPVSESLVIREDRDGIAIITLNRPQAMNALSSALSAALADTFRALQKDDSISAAILTGSGRAFCAGLDLKELGNSEGKDALDDIESTDVGGALRTFDRPIIGAINGVAVTGGFELALMCDILVAAEEARFADTHARIGVIPGWGLSQLLTRIVGINRAREISFTGNFLSAQKAETWGLVNRVVPKEELLETCLQLGRDMAGCDPLILRAYKKLINDGARLSLGDAIVLEEHTHHSTRHLSSGEAIAARRSNVIARGRDQTGE